MAVMTESALRKRAAASLTDESAAQPERRSAKGKGAALLTAFCESRSKTLGREVTEAEMRATLLGGKAQ